MKNTNNAKTRVYNEISDQIYQTIDYVFNGALSTLYRVIFERAFEKMPAFTVTFILSLLKITTAQYKIYCIDLSKKEFEQKTKVVFIQDLAKRLTKELEMNCYETFTEDVPEAEKKQCEKMTRDFIKKLDKKLEKLLTPKKEKASDEKEVQEVQEVQTTSEEPKVVEVENLPFEKTSEGIELLKEFAKDFNNNDVLDQIKKKLHNPYYPAFQIIKMAEPYVVKEKPQETIKFDESPENIELLKKFAQISINYTHKNVWGASKKQDEMLELLKEKWNLSCNEIFKLSEPYYDKLVDEYYKEKEEKEAERERAEKERQRMLIKCKEVNMLNFAVSILIKEKQKLQLSLSQLYQESDHMDFTEKQIAINNCKVDLNEAQELITKILSLRNAGYIPQYYTSAFDNEEDRQIVTEAWTNFLSNDIYNPENKEEAIANLKLIFNKLRKF